MNLSDDYTNVTQLRKRQATASNYTLVANLGTFALVACQNFASMSSPVFAIGISLGLATMVDAQIDRLRANNATATRETQFVQQHGKHGEAVWVEQLTQQERSAVKKFRIATALSVSSVIAGFVVGMECAPHLKSFLMPATIIVGLFVSMKATKKSEQHLKEVREQRLTLVDQIHQRRTHLSEQQSNTQNLPAPHP